jgi:aminodeoxyfutalosine synthase
MDFVWQQSELRDIADKVFAGERLNFEDGIRLMRTHDLPALGFLANYARRKKVGENAYFYLNLNVNPTNICVAHCQMCAFRRDGDEPDAYILDLDEFESRVRACLPMGLNEVHIVGGLYPKLPITYYEDICRRVKIVDPRICVHAYTAIEIDYISKVEKMSYRDVLLRLKAAGLDNMPGGGAEIFNPAIREKISRGKISAEKWLEVHQTAHQLGINTNATMLYGHIESIEDRMDHLYRLRELQDVTGGFNCFIPLAFHPDNTIIEMPRLAGGDDNLRVIATARLFLDNFPHIKAIWTYLGWKLAQTALDFGADDLHGTNVAEKIVHDAGAQQPDRICQDDLIRMIIESGRIPVLTNSNYTPQQVMTTQGVSQCLN